MGSDSSEKLESLNLDLLATEIPTITYNFGKIQSGIVSYTTHDFWQTCEWFMIIYDALLSNAFRLALPQ